MNFKTLFRSGWVWLLLLLFLLLLFVSALTSWYFIPWLQDKLVTTVKEQSKGLYSLQLHGLDASLLGGSISADSLHFTPNYDEWEARAAAAQKDTGQAELPLMLIDLRSRTFKLSGVNFIGILRGKPLDVSRLRLQQPILKITQMREDTTQQDKALHETVQGIAREARIGRIQLEDGALRFRQGKESEVDRFTVKGLHLDVKNLQLDSTSFQAEDRAFYASSIALETGMASYLLPDGTYRLRAGALKANTSDGTLNIGKLEVIPLLKPAAMAGKKGMSVSTMKVDVPEINCSGVDYKAYSRYSHLVAELVNVESPTFSAYMDRKNFPQKGDKPLPHDLVQDLKTLLVVNKIEVKGMHVRYEELAPEAVETGVITFENLYATITNLTNDKNRMSADSPAVVDVKARINGEAPMAVTVRMNLLDQNAFHTLEGSVGPADPATMNPILEPTTFLSVKEGQLHKSDFRLEVYRNRATGHLNARYSNFKVDILTQEEDRRQSLGKKILSKVANKFVIASDNPKQGEELRTGPIEVTRAKNRSVFNYWKDCLVSGFRSAAGIEGFGEDLNDPDRG
ncbi:DUF748 domain-containing protein [Pontibacter roseus]|uniref:DUF748 domain-containing protein n=1 Tax=Pontibacter roseus TaxID=336989 RepID=UPI00037CBCF1|nr:DUF748 domain-containing protein [Pontibacter roseus]